MNDRVQESIDAHAANIVEKLAVFAHHAGTVIFVGMHPVKGLSVEVALAEPETYTFADKSERALERALYARLSDTTVEVGDVVEKGDVLGHR